MAAGANKLKTTVQLVDPEDNLGPQPLFQAAQSEAGSPRCPAEVHDGSHASIDLDLGLS